MAFANENAYDAIIATVVEPYADDGVTVPLVKAIIATESGFKPTAYRAEAHLKPPDASRGLMQILLRTAQGVGFKGDAQQLYNPVVNITYGVKFLAALIRARGGDVLSAVSAYNNGHGKRATKVTTVCNARDAAGQCVRSFTAQPGQFLNQPYVDKVVGYLKTFGGVIPQTVARAGGGGMVGVLLLVGLVLAGRVVRAT